MNDTPTGALSPDATEPSFAGFEPPPAAATPYRVLARKYRPRSFEDLIGQDAMVRTLSNAFAAGRIPQAWMLTGVRGVGKTTTARILARGLNYQPHGRGRAEQPTIHMPDLGEHCEAIIEGRHIDVLEIDAASHTGVDNIRQINDAVRYAPATARYKVYIIDEVHMLSTAAFNGLLKTLEEPPEHVKFVFATTEIRKVPITVLSRCQRFDLRRVEAEAATVAVEERRGEAVDRPGGQRGRQRAEADQLPDIAVDLMPQLVREDDLDLLGGELVQQGIGEDDSFRIPDTGKHRIGLLRLLAHVHLQHVRDRHPLRGGEGLDPLGQGTVADRLVLVEQRHDQDRREIGEEDRERHGQRREDRPPAARVAPNDGVHPLDERQAEDQAEGEPL